MKKGLLTGLLVTLCLPALANNWEFDMNFGVGLSDYAVGDSAQYLFNDGSTETLYAGDGFTFMLGRNLTNLGPIDLNLKAGFHTGNIAHSQYNATLKDEFRFFPVFLSGRLNVTPTLSVSAGASYLLFPSYKIVRNAWTGTADLTSNLGYTMAAAYLFDNRKMGLNVRYSSNSARYGFISDGTSDPVDISATRDEQVEILTFGLTFRF